MVAKTFAKKTLLQITSAFIISGGDAKQQKEN